MPSDPYQAEDDHRTLTRAEDIRTDPTRMKKVAAFHRTKMRQMTKIGSSLKRRAPSRSSGR